MSTVPVTFTGTDLTLSRFGWVGHGGGLGHGGQVLPVGQTGQVGHTGGVTGVGGATGSGSPTIPNIGPVHIPNGIGNLPFFL